MIILTCNDYFPFSIYSMLCIIYVHDKFDFKTHTSYIYIKHSYLRHGYKLCTQMKKKLPLSQISISRPPFARLSVRAFITKFYIEYIYVYKFLFT